MNDPDEQVRRLLASARADEPVPPQVAARLDDVLAELSAEHAQRHEVGSLASRRRRRGVTWAVAAAAAVVVGGVGVAQVFQTGGDETLSAGDSAGQASEESSTRDRADGPTLSQQGDALTGSPTAPGRAETGPAVLGAATFEADVVALRALGPAAGTSGSLAAPGCLAVDPRPGDQVLEVLYDGEEGALLLRPARASGQRALVYLCGETEPARSALVPAP